MIPKKSGLRHVAFLLLFVFFQINLAVFAQELEQTSASSPSGVPTDAALISNGQQLFSQNCKTCHEVHKQAVGPALKNVYDRRPLNWIYAFVKNSQKVIQSGDEYAVNLYNQYNQTQMTSFSDFSDEEILSIMAYIQDETLKGEVIENKAPDNGKEVVAQSNPYVDYILVGFVIVLLLIVLVLVLILTIFKKYLNDRTDLDEDDLEVVNQKINIQKIVRNKIFITIVVLIFVSVVIKASVDGLFNIGVQQGYQPTQPIAFSHKIHAGQFQIDCQYCHTGVRKSKNANIPSANICMNCHSQIKTESSQIQLIYKAIEDERPIEWVRVHNLPDLAYFNHAQHVNVGGIECQTCHGPIEEMDVVQQHTRLTMGWCINCHRQTAINTKDNAYYDKLVEIHKDSKEPLKVEDIGGLECSKCHY